MAYVLSSRIAAWDMTGLRSDIKIELFIVCVVKGFITVQSRKMHCGKKLSYIQIVCGADKFWSGAVNRKTLRWKVTH